MKLLRPNQLSHDLAIGAAIDAALSRRPEPWAKRARHESIVRAAARGAGIALTPAEVRHHAARLSPMIDQHDARMALRSSLAVADHRARTDAVQSAARRLGAAQGRALAHREAAETMTGALTAAIGRARHREAAERERRLSLHRSPRF